MKPDALHSSQPSLNHAQVERHFNPTPRTSRTPPARETRSAAQHAAPALANAHLQVAHLGKAGKENLRTGRSGRSACLTLKFLDEVWWLHSAPFILGRWPSSSKRSSLKKGVGLDTMAKSEYCWILKVFDHKRKTWTTKTSK